MATILYLLMLLVAVPASAAPSGPTDFLDGIDDFLAAFGGLALSGDPLAEAEQEEPTAEPVTEPAVVTEVSRLVAAAEGRGSCWDRVSGNGRVLLIIVLRIA